MPGRLSSVITLKSIVLSFWLEVARVVSYPSFFFSLYG